MDGGELTEDAGAGQDAEAKDATNEGVSGAGTAGESDRKPFNSHQSGWSRRDDNQRTSKVVNANVLPS